MVDADGGLSYRPLLCSWLLSSPRTLIIDSLTVRQTYLPPSDLFIPDPTARFERRGVWYIDIADPLSLITRYCSALQWYK